ncbi:MAG: caspase family protein [Myxococcales bacterium]|nr:caspase family protein [Myxococcales bacterium]
MLGLAMATLASASGADGEVRLALVVSSNHGMPDELPLVYADQDASRVADMLLTLGGYGPGDVWVVPDASVDEVYRTLTRLTVRAQEVASNGGTPRLFTFYAGHAGVDGLHIDGEVLPLPDLKAAIRVVPASDRVVVLDACHAGTIARSRGAQLVQVSDRPQGFTPPTDEAWLTSSGPEERSFEVEDRRGALFTHFFLSGARGAADTDADQQVTLGELYAFVRTHTAAAAADLGRLQQPRWSGDLAGFALTNVGASPTGVRVPGPVSAPLLVLDAAGERVVAEVPKGGGTSLALPAGRYEVLSVAGGSVSMGTLVVPDGTWTVFAPDEQLRSVRGVRARGGTFDPTPWSVDVGYAVDLGSHGAFLNLQRALGRGHAVGVGVRAGTLPISTPWQQGSDTLLAVQLTWMREITGPDLVLAPGLALTAGRASHRVQRAPHPVWGEWYGQADAPELQHSPLAGLAAGVGLEVPLDRWALASWVDAGLASRDARTLLPVVSGRLGLRRSLR